MQRETPLKQRKEEGGGATPKNKNRYSVAKTPRLMIGNPRSRGKFWVPSVNTKGGRGKKERTRLGNLLGRPEKTNVCGRG